MPMTLSDVPLTGQTLDQTRNPIRNNFVSINNAFEIDHQGYNTVGAGKHNKVTFPNQTPAPTFTPPEVGLYNFVNPTSTVNELYVSKSNGTQVPMTASSQINNGWTYLPSGLLIKWGNITGDFPNGTWQQFMFPSGAGIPNFTTVFNITLQAVSLDTPPGTQTHTFNYLTVASNFTTAFFWWIPRTNIGNVNQQSVFYFAMGN